MTNTTHLRELIERAWSMPSWAMDRFGNLCTGMKPLFKRTGATNADAALILALVNQAPAMLDELDALRPALDEDWLEEVISDSLDMDWRPRDAAKAIVAALKQGTPT